jgi:hypothetical protein
MALAALPPLEPEPPRSRSPRLPRRDAAARAHLADVARHARPVTLAHERALALGESLAPLVPRGTLPRGSVVRVVGEAGAGVATIGFELAAACTAAGEWAAAVDPAGTLGALAAGEAGVTLERFAVVRRVPPARWATVVAALLDGMSLVLAEVPPGGVGAADARRLVARAREREAVLVVSARWPAETSLTLRAAGCDWTGLGEIDHLTERRVHVHAEGRAGVRDGVLARAG